MTIRMVTCKDCLVEGVTTVRKLATKADGSLEPGPRCITHFRARRKATRLAAHARRLETNFGITAEIYWALYEAQGGKCWICGVANGTTKRLAVEHDHRLCADEAADLGLPPPHPPEQGCPRCIRCLSCGRCNRLVAFLGIEALCRAIQVLGPNPPARKVIADLMAV